MANKKRILPYRKTRFLGVAENTQEIKSKKSKTKEHFFTLFTKYYTFATGTGEKYLKYIINIYETTTTLFYL